jgi:hypothetical protein
MLTSEIISSGGTMEQQTTTVAKVSFWHIPRGSDYHNATTVKCFFDNAEKAEAFANKYSQPPEMAVVAPIQHMR